MREPVNKSVVFSTYLGIHKFLLRLSSVWLFRTRKGTFNLEPIIIHRLVGIARRNTRQIQVCLSLVSALPLQSTHTVHRNNKMGVLNVAFVLMLILWIGSSPVSFFGVVSRLQNTPDSCRAWLYHDVPQSKFSQKYAFL